MNEKLKQLIETILPFLILGVAIALIIGFFIMFSYILLWGLLIGTVIWLISFIKLFFLTAKKTSNPFIKSKGRIIEHDKQD